AIPAGRRPRPCRARRLRSGAARSRPRRRSAAPGGRAGWCRPRPPPGPPHPATTPPPPARRRPGPAGRRRRSAGSGPRPTARHTARPARRRHPAPPGAPRGSGRPPGRPPGSRDVPRPQPARTAAARPGPEVPRPARFRPVRRSRRPGRMDGGGRRMAHDRIWDEARRELAGLPGGWGLNIAHEAVDRHAAGPRRDLVALRCHRRDGPVETLTYSELAEAPGRFANVLAGLGVGPGDRVATLLGPGAEQHVALLGTLKARAVACPLFASFGPEPVRARAARAAARVLVTTPALHRRKVAPVRHRLPGLAHVLLAGGEPGATGAGRPDAGTLDLASLLAATPAAWTVPATDPDDEALVHFTSGTTGTPKGAVHVHEAVVAHHATAARALGLGPDDVFWCTADPGWVTGTSYGVVAPLT